MPRSSFGRALWRRAHRPVDNGLPLTLIRDEAGRPVEYYDGKDGAKGFRVTKVSPPEEHYFALIRLARQHGLTRDRVVIHIFTDGRDTPPRSGAQWVADFQRKLDLYDTGISDAMYLAGLIADDAKMTKKDLQRWADGAYWYMLSEYTVPWVAAGSPHGWELALEWIDSTKPLTAEAGWATLRSLVSTQDDSELDLPELKRLLERVRKNIHQAPNDVRSSMNSFVIAVGSYVQPLTDTAIQTGEKIGPVTADLGNNSCHVPFAPDYIRKVQKRGTIGKKRKSAKC